LENLNKRLRDVIVKANPQRQNTYSLPPLAKTNAQGRSTDPRETLQSHLDYLEKSIQTIDHEQGHVTKYQQESGSAVEERIEELNREVRGLLLPYDPHHPEPPALTGTGLNQQLLYFQDSIGAVEMELSSVSSKGNKIGDSAEMEKMVMGLWDIFQSGEQDIRRWKQERRAARVANGLPADEDDSPDDGADFNETFSLQAFSTKIQILYTQATRVKDQKKVLQRQIKQQRELNSKSDATEDVEMQAKVEELERVNALLTRTETDSDRIRNELSKVMEELEVLREQGASGASAAELETAKQTIHDLEDQLQEREDDHRIGSAEVESHMAESESKIADLTGKLTTAGGAIKDKEQEVARVKIEVARLQTEVTIARAELDSAYGSRAERAAEFAALQSPVSAEEVQTLKKGLEETIAEYEAMTKASIEWEKERDRLEEMIDRMRYQLKEEKVRWMGIMSPRSKTPGSTSTSTMVLRNEFKKMMRDTRAENAKALRVCYSLQILFYVKVLMPRRPSKLNGANSRTNSERSRDNKDPENRASRRACGRLRRLRKA
jgi:predicted  nucleic acid-binding Zn-ribbon protein